NGLEVVHQLLLREVLRPVERHVLDEVGQTALVLVFENGAGVDDQPQLGALRGLAVHADVVAKAVGQCTRGDAGIQRKRRLELLARTGNGEGDAEDRGQYRRSDVPGHSVFSGRAVMLRRTSPKYRAAATARQRVAPGACAARRTGAPIAGAGAITAVNGHGAVLAPPGRVTGERTARWR